MKTTYLVWKDPTCHGANPDWQEISGKEFLALVRSPDGKGRWFIKMDSTERNGADGAVVMEATKSEYVRWRKEKDHSDWVREGQAKRGYKVVSYNAIETEDGCFGEELLADEDSDVETDCHRQFERERVKAALAALSDEEREMIGFLLISGKGSERDFARLTGIPQKTINDRKNRAIAKLKKNLK